MPIVRNSFVGRARDLDEVIGRLGRSQLVTLVGPGGVGKTRLAVEVGARLDDRGQSVAFVDLALLADPEAVIGAVAAALGAQGSPGQPLMEAVVARAAETPLLVVLDNCEHLLARCSQLADALAGTCPALRILATSRQRLGTPAELVWPVPPLSLPTPASGARGLPFAGSEAVQLFCERAEALEPSFAPTGQQIVAVTEICQRLDGNPLAIECAASWVNVLSPEDIAAHLEDRFALLTRGAPTAPPRHRSLRAALDWSYGLLSDPERLLLARLSVFAGGFFLDAVRDVCGDGDGHRVLDLVSVLVDKSLVVAGHESKAVRYRLHETVRAYAADRLRELEPASAVRERHATWCLSLVEPGPGAKVDRVPGVSGAALETEQDDVRAALAWALSEHRPELALRLAAVQMRQWERQGSFEEARGWLERVLATSEAAPAALRAAAHHDTGFAALVMGDFDAARIHLQASVTQWERAGDRTARARTKSLLSFLSTFGDGPCGVEELEADVAEVRHTGDRVCLFEVLTACGQARMFRGEPHIAGRHFSESVSVARGLGDRCLLPAGLVGLGAAELARGDYSPAGAHLREGAELAAAAGDDHTEVVGWCWLGELDRLQGEHRSGRARLEECLARSRTMGAPYPLAMSLLGLGRAVLEDGDALTARDHFREAETTAGSAGLAHVVVAALVGQGQVATAVSDPLGAARVFDQALALARRRGNQAGSAGCAYHLGRLARAEGTLERAVSLHLEAMAIYDAVDDRGGLAASLEAVAGLAAAGPDDDDDRAARLFGAARSLRDAVGCARPRLERATYDADVARLGQRLATDHLGSAWAQGANLSRADALALARDGVGSRRRHARGWGALTPAERRVADLVAQGMTNAEVAGRLFVSPETVKSHLSRVLAKLGMKSRRELRLSPTRDV